MAEWVRDHGPLPLTWEQATPSGGSHWLFRHDSRLEAVPLGALSMNGRRLGIDIKGNATHYVLGAPSITSKGIYRWVRGPRDCELADAPEWLIRLILAAKTVVPAAPVAYSRIQDCDRVERARQHLRQIPPAIERQGGDPHSWRTALKVARGFALTVDESMAAMASWNRTCEPPWRESDLRRLIIRALERGSAIALGSKLERKAA